MAVQIHMTAAEFFELPESNLPCELIDGEVIQMPSPVPEHQDVVLSSAVVIKQKAKTLGGRVFIAPLDVHLDEANVLQPDVMWIAPESQCEVGEKRLSGPPDFIIEVLSPGSAWQDKRVKFRLYERFGVREYWIINPTERLIEVWQHVNHAFVLVNVYAQNEIFESPLLGTVEAQAIFGD